MTIINLGFIFGLFISMRLLDEFGFHGVFIAALILNGVIFLNALIGFRDINEVFTKKLKSIELLKKIFRRKDIFSIYLVSFSLEFFYALMVIYTPIYLSDLGISWGNIGIIFTVMLIPFVLLQYPAGILADRKRGEKGLIIFSLFLMLATTLVCFFTNTKEIFVWAAILFGTRIGAALVEILRDSYFYKKIDGQDVDIIGFFRTAMPVAYIAAAGVSAIWLLFFPVKAVFLVVSLVMVLALYPAFRLPSNK
ncbi:MAG: MFS transporter [Candidatus Moranbacteria bacterium]|nr:MFS transporter [Candidatus Moranbacteria bacterium]